MYYACRRLDDVREIGRLSRKGSRQQVEDMGAAWPRDRGLRHVGKVQPRRVGKAHLRQLEAENACNSI
jgi:hypothetical protein